MQALLEGISKDITRSKRGDISQHELLEGPLVEALRNMHRSRYVCVYITNRYAIKSTFFLSLFVCVFWKLKGFHLQEVSLTKCLASFRWPVEVCWNQH